MTSRPADFVKVNIQGPQASPEFYEARRMRRLERREKQRLANGGRALKMRAARLSVEREEEPIHIAPPTINVGCSGWFYWHWRGSFYPETLPTKEWFHHYAESFPTVELNAPFYSWPTVNTVKSWLKQAGRKDFIYTVKVCELITHVKRFGRTQTLVKDFGFIGDILGQQMGCFLFQLPPSYAYSPTRLTSILRQLDHSRRNVIEFRHRSWWNDNVYRALRKVGTIFCSISAPKLPDELVTTAEDIYIRFHGRTSWYRHDYTAQELAAWVRRIDKSGSKRIWAYFNNDRNAFAIKNAREFAGQLAGVQRACC